MKQTINYLRPTLVFLSISTLLFGVIYPVFSTLLLQGIFPKASNASLIVGKDGKVLGSSLIGQNFTNPKYFWGRISATSPVYNASASSGSNLGVNNPNLLKLVKERAELLRNYATDKNKAIPLDLVTASGSGLDPHISISGANYQIQRVAKYRKLPEKKVKELVEKYTQKRQFGILGEPRVNVLKLNLALDEKI
ncbi:MAG: potassium-transporting ATPase subunit KdpC [Alphaproteobacteria bacterium]|jgi:K+-transporting ATPase ATPase C chain